METPFEACPVELGVVEDDMAGTDLDCIGSQAVSQWALGRV